MLLMVAEHSFCEPNYEKVDYGDIKDTSARQAGNNCKTVNIPWFDQKDNLQKKEQDNLQIVKKGP